jgi:hypothetical protein
MNSKPVKMTQTLKLLHERGHGPLAELNLQQMERAGVPFVADPVRVDGIDEELWIRPLDIKERCEFTHLKIDQANHGWQVLAACACDPETGKILYNQSDIPVLKWAYQFGLADLLTIEQKFLTINGWQEYIAPSTVR